MEIGELGVRKKYVYRRIRIWSRKEKVNEGTGKVK